jgi:hypothetical protein
MKLARWTTAPIKRTCETTSGVAGAPECGKKATHAYQALRGGWVALCKRHAANVHPHCIPIAELLANGQTLVAQ